MARRTNHEQQMLAEARAEIAIADQKAGTILAAAGIGFAAVLGGLLAGDWRPSAYAAAGQAVWSLGASLALATVASAGVALWPRFTARGEAALISYWAHIARYASVEALEEALEGQPADPQDRTRHQLWRIAKVVRIKYWCIRISLVCGGAAICSFLLAAAIG